MKTDAQLIFEAYVNTLMEDNSLQRVKSLIQAGIDIFYTEDGGIAYVIFNTGSRTRDPSESILTPAAYDELFKNNTPENIDTGYMDESIFYDPAQWKLLNLQALNALTNKELRITDHNGSVFFIVKI